MIDMRRGLQGSSSFSFNILEKGSHRQWDERVFRTQQSRTRLWDVSVKSYASACRARMNVTNMLTITKIVNWHKFPLSLRQGNMKVYSHFLQFWFGTMNHFCKPLDLLREGLGGRNADMAEPLLLQDDQVNIVLASSLDILHQLLSSS